MLKKDLSKPAPTKLKVVKQKKDNKTELDRAIKLSIFTQFYPPDYAATGQLIEELAIQLGKLGISVNVFTGQPGYAFRKESALLKERLDKLFIRRSRTARLWNSRIRGKAINGILFCLRSGLHLIKSAGRGDILLITTAPPFLQVLGYLANRCFGTPYVCLIYDLYPDVAVELNVVSTKNWLVQSWNWLNKKIWRQAQSIVVLSSTMKERVIAKCPEVKDKISVIHNWANPDWIIPLAKQDNWFAQKHDLVNKFTVMYSGNMGRCHEMDTIMTAAKQLQNEDIQFVFIGGGAKQQICVQQDLPNCRFLPYQEKHILPHSLTACDLSLVSISSGMEGLVAPSKLYGILAAGRPVAAICEPHSYLKLLLSEAKCGATFNNGDGTGLATFIRRLAQDRELALNMGTAGREYLESNFTPEIIALEYSKLLRQAVKPETSK
ncbi:MAG: glycosyltransferase family 4 protein [Tatlockia sp.]|nr:glycosyltransferase family 4 protein [Tatlockia sp.]